MISTDHVQDNVKSSQVSVLLLGGGGGGRGGGRLGPVQILYGGGDSEGPVQILSRGEG